MSANNGTDPLKGTPDELESALELAARPKDTRTVLDLIATMEPELARSLQSEAAAAILTRHYYSAIRYSEELRQCTAESLVAALLLSAQVRLEPGPLGHVWLVPFADRKRRVHEVVWMLGYTGIVELARRGGASGLRSTVVWDCDELVAPWEDERGLHWRHLPGASAERGERVGCLVSWTEGRLRQALLMEPARVEQAIKASRNPQAAALREEDWYWRKTAVRFARPWLPLSGAVAAFATAVHADGAAVRGIEIEQGEAVPVLEGGGE